MEYTLIRSRRKTLAIEISRDGSLIVRAPMRCSQKQIDQFLSEKAAWILTHQKRQLDRIAAHPEPDDNRWIELKEAALDYIPDHVHYYSRMMGVTPTAVHYSKAKTRFGSCSSKNSITFSLRLMDYPLEAVDYVIVHELAHIKYKNHGKDFYRFVSSVMPDYKRREKLLRM